MSFPNGLPHSSGSRVDITSLQPFNADATTVAGTGAFVTLLSVTGKGYLESFYTFQTTAQPGFQIRVTIDGVVKILLGNAITNNIIGVVTKQDLFGSGTAGTNTARNPTTFLSSATQVPTAIKSYPITDGSDGAVLLGDTKIYFYNSLTLEIFAAVGSTYRYHYTGGYRT